MTAVDAPRRHPSPRRVRENGIDSGFVVGLRFHSAMSTGTHGRPAIHS